MTAYRDNLSLVTIIKKEMHLRTKGETQSQLGGNWKGLGSGVDEREG